MTLKKAKKKLSNFIVIRFPRLARFLGLGLYIMANGKDTFDAGKIDVRCD